MRLDNHIAYRFLTDDTLPMEMMESMYPGSIDKINSDEKLSPEEKAGPYSIWKLANKDDQKAFWITNTVLDKLEYLRVKKKYTEEIGEHYDWTYFKNIENQKVTFIFPNNTLLRIHIEDDILNFCHTEFVPGITQEDRKRGRGTVRWVLFYVKRDTGEQCDHFKHIDVRTIEEFVYKLMVFFFLTENDYTIVEPGKKYGTKKNGKFINTLDIPLTVVNSKWNTTSIRTEGFGVKGHFALRWSGKGKTTPKVVFIEPFEKKGYTRQSGKESFKTTK